MTVQMCHSYCALRLMTLQAREGYNLFTKIITSLAFLQTGL